MIYIIKMKLIIIIIFGGGWKMINKLNSGWGTLLPCTIVIILFWLDISHSTWRLVTELALLSTAVMLLSTRLRSYVLLPSCVVLAGVLAILLRVVLLP